MSKSVILASLFLTFLSNPFGGAVAFQSSRYVHAEERFSLDPPAGWFQVAGSGATVVKFASPLEGDKKSMFDVIVARASTATPLPEFIRQLKESHKKRFTDHKVYLEKDLAVQSRGAYQIILEVKDKAPNPDLAYLQTIIQRSWMSFFSIDMVCQRKDLENFLPVYNKVIESFRFEDWVLNDRERKAWDNFVNLLDGVRDVRSELMGDEWFSILYKDKSFGYYHVQVREAAEEGRKGYGVLSELYENAEPGVYSRSTTNGFFSSDFSYQRMERRDEVVPKEKGKIENQYHVVIDQGKAQIKRNIRGLKEEKTIHVDRHVLLKEVAEVARRLMLGSSQKEFLVQNLFLSEDAVSIELWETVGKEKLKFDDILTEMNLIFLTRDRKHKMHLWYDDRKNLKKEYVPETPFALKSVSKETATKGFEAPK